MAAGNSSLVVPLCLVIGGIVGAAQGYWIAYQKIPAFIVTLAGMLVFRGLTYLVLSATARSVRSRRNSGSCRTGFIPDFLSISSIRRPA